MIDFAAGMRIAHLLGRRKPDPAASTKLRAAGAPAPSRPSAQPPSKPQPRTYATPPEPRATAAELKAAFAGALAAQRDGDAYLRLLEQEDEAEAFAARWERVSAELEGRPIRKHLHSGPPQPSHAPMSSERFSALFDKVQQKLASN